MIGASCCITCDVISAVDVSERCLCLKPIKTLLSSRSLKAPPIKIKLQTYLNLADRSFELISRTSCSLIRRRHFCSLIKVPAGWYSASLREELPSGCTLAEVHEDTTSKRRSAKFKTSRLKQRLVISSRLLH